MGIRLEEKVNEDVEITEQASYPTDHLVFGRFLSELYGTFMYPSEEGQIRSAEDLKRTATLSASGGVDLSVGAIESLKKYGYFDHLAEKETEIYSIAVEDFATPMIEKGRGAKRFGHYLMKTKLIKKAGKDIEKFLDE